MGESLWTFVAVRRLAAPHITRASENSHTASGQSGMLAQSCTNLSKNTERLCGCVAASAQRRPRPAHAHALISARYNRETRSACLLATLLPHHSRRSAGSSCNQALPVAKTTQLHIHRLDGIEQLVHTKASPDSSSVPVTAFPFETAGPAT